MPLSRLGKHHKKEICSWRGELQALKKGVQKTEKRVRLSVERLGELLDLAAEVFLSRGFAETSIAEIAQRGNASKTTFYSRYRTKEDLFLAVIERRMREVFEQVATFEDAGTLEQTLTQFGERLLRVALAPRQLALVRMINAEAARQPALARRYFELGPKRGEEALAKYLAGCVKAGLLRGEKPLVMARTYINLLSGNPIRWFVMGFDSKPVADADCSRQVSGAVHVFLRAYGAQG